MEHARMAQSRQDFYLNGGVDEHGAVVFEEDPAHGIGSALAN